MSGLGINFGPNDQQNGRNHQQPNPQGGGNQRRNPNSQRPTSAYGNPNPTSHPNNIQVQQSFSRRPLSSSGATQAQLSQSSLGRGLSSIERRVRIASGEPNVMGHGVGHLEGDYVMTPPAGNSLRPGNHIGSGPGMSLNGLGMFGMGLGLGIQQGQHDGINSASTSSSSSFRDDSSSFSSTSYNSEVPKDRNKRLSLAVKSMGSNPSSNSSNSSTSSSPFSNDSNGKGTPNSSNGNESSSSTGNNYSSGGEGRLKSALKKPSNNNLRKQTSQPNLSLSRSTTIRPGSSLGNNGGGKPKTLGHSQSSITLGSQYSASSAGYNSESGNSASSSGMSKSSSSSLGRSYEIGRGGTRRANAGTTTFDGSNGKPPASIPPAAASSTSSSSSQSSNSNKEKRAQTKIPIKIKPEDLVDAPTSDSGEKMIPDGFGSYVELSRATSQIKPPSVKSLALSESDRNNKTSTGDFELDAVSETDEEEGMRNVNFSSSEDEDEKGNFDGDLTLTPKSNPIGSTSSKHDNEEDTIAFNGDNSRALPDLSLSFSGLEHHISPPKAVLRKRSQSFGPDSQPTSGASSHAERPAISSGFQVGSFYGPSGDEIARLDQEGKISRSSSPTKSNQPSFSFSSGGRRRSRSHSQVEPIRNKMMSSPNPAAKDDGGGRPGSSLGILGSASLKDGLNGGEKVGPPKPLPNPTGSSISDPTNSKDERKEKSSNQLHTMVSMRSARGWKGLEGVENGSNFVSLEGLTNSISNSSFEKGMEILPNKMSKRNTGEESVLLPSANPEDYVFRRQSHALSESDTEVSNGTTELGPKDSVSNVGYSGHHQRSLSSSHPQRKELRLQGGPPSMRRTTSSAGEPQINHGRSMSMGRSQSAGGNANPILPPTNLPAAPTSSSSSTSSNGNQNGLERHSTLISTSSNPARRSRELNRLLGNSGRKLNSSASSTSESNSNALASIVGTDSNSSSATSRPPSSVGNHSNSLVSVNSLSRSNAVNSQTTLPPAVLEQAKSKARVQVDLVLESDMVVEGGILRGRMEVKVRNGKQDVMLAQPKIRVVGFEELLNDDTRHIFYHHASVLDGDRSSNGPTQPYVLHGSPNLSSPQAEGKAPLPCFGSPPDSEGYCAGKKGTHSIPFALEIPIGKGAKGSYRGKNALVRYIVIGSIKLKNPDNTNRSIAHFYRHVELFPYLNPAVVLSSAPRPVTATASKGLFLGGSGKVHLTASLHRTTWVAGQRVHINVGVLNETTKKVKSLTLSLIRTVTLFRPRPELNVGRSSSNPNANSNSEDWNHDAYVDPDACNTSTSRKKIGEETLEMGQKGSKGFVTAKGWWTGVEAGGEVDFSHYMCLPLDALSISRGRHVEVLYSIKVSVGSSLSSDVSVELPLRVINFVSLDPPPNKALTSSSKSSSEATSARGWNNKSGENAGSRNSSNPASSSSRQKEEPLIERVRTAEQLRSPGKVERQPLPALQKLSPLAGSQPLPNVGENKPISIEEQRSKRLQHQKSLDFINHAIRSATARKAGVASPTAPLPFGLGIEVPEGAEAIEEVDEDGIDSDDSDEEEEDREKGGATPLGSYNASVSGFSMSSASTGPINPNCMPYDHRIHQASGQPDPAQLAEAQRQLSALQAQERLALGLHPLPPSIQMNSIALDDVPDDYETSDDEQEPDADKTLNLNDDSVDEVDMVVGSARLTEESSPMFRRYSPRDADESFDSVSTTRGIREELQEEDEEEERSFDRDNSRDDSDDEEIDGLDEYSSAPCKASRRESPYQLAPEPQSNVGPSPRSRLSPHAPVYKPVSASNSPAGSSSSSSHSGTPSFDSSKPITAKVPVFSRDPAVKAGANLVRTKTLHRASSNLESQLHPPVNMTNSVRAGSSSSGSSSGGSRPTSPVKPSASTASPTKSAMKTKSSFTFATADSPIKSSSSSGKSKEATEAPRAKVDPSQLPKAKTRASHAANSVVGSNPQQAPAASSSSSSSSAGNKKTQANGKNGPRKSKSSPNLNPNADAKSRNPNSSGQSKKKNYKSKAKKNSTSPSMRSESSGGSSPASTESSLPTPEMNSNLPLPGVVGIDAVGEDSMEEPRSQSNFNSLPKSKSQSQVSKLSSPDKKSETSSPVTPTQTLRHSASTASLTGDRLQRSHSTHNLRGAAVVLPSVRNKIAMLESRKQMLKEFVGTNGEEKSPSAVNGNSTPNRTPTKSNTPSSESRVAALGAAFSDPNGSPLRCSGIPRRESNSSLTPSSSGRLNLQRQGSIASSIGTTATEDTTDEPAYLKRMPSTMSFKAPVLRSVKEKEKVSKANSSNGPAPVKIGR